MKNIKIAASVGLDALSLKIGLYENDYPITQPEMQKIYLNEQQKYGMEYCARAFQYLCDAAGECGISIAGENLMTPEEFTKMSEMVDRSNFYLYFDSQNYHLFRGYSELAILEGLYPKMCNQLHVKDGQGAMSGGLLGTGDSGFHETMHWLDNHDYSGYILLENYYDQLPLPASISSAKSR